MVGIVSARDSTRAVPLASRYRRASTRRPPAVAQPVNHPRPIWTSVTRSQMNSAPSAHAWSKRRASSAVLSTCSVTVSKRSGDRRMTGSEAVRHSVCTQFAHDDLLLVGGDVVCDEERPCRYRRAGAGRDSTNRATCRPSAADTCVGQGRQTRRPALRSRTLAASPAMPAPIIATSCPSWLTRAAYRKRRACTGYTPPESLAGRARHSAMEDLCPGVPSGSYL